MNLFVVSFGVVRQKIQNHPPSKHPPNISFVFEHKNLLPENNNVFLSKTTYYKHFSENLSLSKNIIAIENVPPYPISITPYPYHQYLILSCLKTLCRRVNEPSKIFSVYYTQKIRWALCTFFC